MPDEPIGIWARRAAAEGIGTFFLVLIGPGAVMVNAYSDGAIGHAGVAVAFAFVVLAMIYALGHLSGAHINPAVTIAFWSAGRFPGREVVPYIAAQCAGAALAAFALVWAIGPVGNVGATIPAIRLSAAAVIEFLLSFSLMFVIMAVATDERVADGFAGLAVGLTVGFCAMMGGPLTGASMNPARSFGPALAGGFWEAHWLYWAAPVGGTIAAAHTYDFLRAASAPGTVPRGVPIGVQGPLDPTSEAGENAAGTNPSTRSHEW
jgi:MIP family channel proteins